MCRWNRKAVGKGEDGAGEGERRESRTRDGDGHELRGQLGLANMVHECAIITASVARLGKGFKTQPGVMGENGAVTVGMASLPGLSMAHCRKHHLRV